MYEAERKVFWTGVRLKNSNVINNYNRRKELHKHHIVPKHMGGTDEPENLIELTVEEHAEAHRKLFAEYGHWQDYVAWQGLAGLITKEELVKQVQSQAAKARIEKYGNPWSGVRTWGNFSINEEFRKHVAVLANAPDAIAKKKKTMAENKHQQGSRNSQFGKKWYVEETANDLTTRKMYMDAPKGWITTTEWKDRRKNKNNNAYGRHWYNDGSKNFYLKESDPQVMNLTRGRLMVVN